MDRTEKERPFRANLFGPTTVVAAMLTLTQLMSGGFDGLMARFAAHPTKVATALAPPTAATQADDDSLDFETRFRPTHLAADLRPAFFGPRNSRITVDLEEGDTLTGLLTRNEVGADEARAAIEALKPVFDVRKARTGQSVVLLFDRAQQVAFRGIEMDVDAERQIAVTRGAQNGGLQFAATQVKRPLTSRTVAARGTIRSSLFEATNNAGVPQSVMAAMIKAFSYDVDFQRDIQPGDKFEVMYDLVTTENGEQVRSGDVLYASLTLSGKQRQVYGWRQEDGSIEYYDRTGKSVRKALLKTPVDGAKLTSGFGMRMHPLLGFTRMHKGVDFGAPVGTPVYAAGDGTVENAGWSGGYGRLIRVKHNAQMMTAYAHLSRFANNVQTGARVRQGQVIGFVGTTGNSTGPHLHYEVLKNGEQVNPSGTMLPAGNNLEDRQMPLFVRLMQDRETQIAGIGTGTQLASARSAIVPVACRLDQPC